MSVRILLLTAFAMLCFAANSLLCRAALAPGAVDAASFTLVRVAAAAAMLAAVVALHRRGPPRAAAFRPLPAAALFVYLGCFSFAYLSLDAGTGALILFGAVQLTMFAAAMRQGERFPPLAWAGLAAAVAGLVYLVAPGVTAPDPAGAALMAAAGIGWGAYSLLGRGAANPLEANAGAFLLCLPAAALLSLVFLADAAMSAEGLALAVASGALASGLGYVVWYMALSGLPSGRAATVQLSVPAIAALGGVALLGEPLTLRLVLASAVMLGGIALVLAQRAGTARQRA